MHAKFDFDMTTWVVSGDTQFVSHVAVFAYFWSVRHAHRSHRWTNFDDLHRVS